MQKLVQAKCISDATVLAIVADRGPISRWDINDFLGEEWPERVVLAKLRSLVNRGLLIGCTCGCRGDFELAASPQGETE